MARKIATSLVFILAGFALAALVDYGATIGAERLGADAGDADLAGKLAFALFWIVAFWLALRHWRKPA
jgi:hypothetical protein